MCFIILQFLFFLLLTCLADADWGEGVMEKYIFVMKEEDGESETSGWQQRTAFKIKLKNTGLICLFYFIFFPVYLNFLSNYSVTSDP